MGIHQVPITVDGDAARAHADLQSEPEREALNLLFPFVVLVAITDVALGVVVLQRNSRSFTNRCFAAGAATMALWMVVNLSLIHI